MAFVLTQVLGLSYVEAAEICECPVGTIRSRVARARDHLVTELTARPDAGSA
jgi:RNA polymerase sigma-70 factor (ECF subfamily)